MRNSFINHEQNEVLCRDGYIIVDLLDSESFKHIKQTITELGFGKDNEIKFFRNIVYDSIERKRLIHEKLKPILQSAINMFLLDYNIMRVAVFDKLAGGEDLPVHQHVSIIDEEKYRPIGAWIPLINTTIKMGTLHVIKASHRIFNHKMRPYHDFEIYQKDLSHKILKKFSTPITLKIGQAIIFDDRLVHWSPANKTSTHRTAIQLSMVPVETQNDLTIYYRINDEELISYKIDPVTFRETDLQHSKPDKLVMVEKIKQPKLCYDNKMFYSKLRSAGIPATNYYKYLFQELFYHK